MYGEYSVVLTWGEHGQQILHIPSGNTEDARTNAEKAVSLKQEALRLALRRSVTVIGHVYHQIARINGAELKTSTVTTTTKVELPSKPEEWR